MTTRHARVMNFESSLNGNFFKKIDPKGDLDREVYGRNGPSLE